MASDELTCREMVELVTQYLEGQLLAAECARFEAHLAACDGCEVYVEQMRQTIRLLGTLSEEQLAPDAQKKLLDTFRQWRVT